MRTHALRRRYGRARDRRVDGALADHVHTLANDYTTDVRRLRAAGDHRAEYHAQRPKVKAYGALMHAGLTPREAIDYFRSVSEIP
jgi:1,6-anhydro-N-acetylmuramate kinase